MNKKERLEVADAFRRAKQRLARHTDEVYTMHKTKYICYALADLSLPWSILDRASKVVCSRIYPTVFVEDWLGRNASDYYDLDDKERSDNTQAYRHRWLDALIKEFSK